MVLHHEPSKLRIKLAKTYTNAGISQDCTMVYFFNASHISVHALLLSHGLGEQPTAPPSREVFKHSHESASSRILFAALSLTWLAVLTDSELELIKIDATATAKAKPLQWSCGDWESVALSMFELDSVVLVALGQRKRNKSHFEGRVLLLQVQHLDGLGFTFPKPDVIPVEHNDFPKMVVLSQTGTLLICCTQLRNAIVISEMPLSPDTGQKPCRIVSGHHTPVRNTRFSSL